MTLPLLGSVRVAAPESYTPGGIRWAVVRRDPPCTRPRGRLAACDAPGSPATCSCSPPVSLTQDAASELLYPLLPLLRHRDPRRAARRARHRRGLRRGRRRDLEVRRRPLVGRRAAGGPFVTAGYGLAALGKVLVAAAYVWPMVLVGRVVDRLGKGVRSAPRDALIASSVPREDLGRAFGFHRTGDTLGAVIGPLIALAGLAAARRRRPRGAVVGRRPRGRLDAAHVPRRREATYARTERRRPVATSRRRRAGPVLPSSPLPRAFWRVTLVLVGIAVVNFPDALLLLRVSDLGFSTTQVVLAYVVYNLVYTLGSYPAGASSDRLPRPLVYGLGLLAFAVAYAGLGLVDDRAVGLRAARRLRPVPRASPTASARRGSPPSSATSTAGARRASSSR